jgi:hypothetical protein
MSGELEVLLSLVAEGRITAEEAAPIVAALDDKEHHGDSAQAADRPGGPTESTSRDRGRSSGRQPQSPSDRRIRVYVAENGRSVINIQIPLAAAGFAIDQVPGLSPDHRSRIVEAIQSGMTGPILEVSDKGNEVRIVIE